MRNYVVIILDLKSDDVGIHEVVGRFTSAEADGFAWRYCEKYGLRRGVDVHVAYVTPPGSAERSLGEMGLTREAS